MYENIRYEQSRTSIKFLGATVRDFFSSLELSLGVLFKLISLKLMGDDVSLKCSDLNL